MTVPGERGPYPPGNCGKEGIAAADLVDEVAQVAFLTDGEGLIPGGARTMATTAKLMMRAMATMGRKMLSN